jgi:hypothetical protein
MCRQCPPFPPPPETRRAFLRKLSGAVAGAGLLGATRVLAQGDPPEVARAGWARLVTDEREWDFHGDRDSQFASAMAASIIQKTGVKFSSTIYHVTPGNLNQLCAHPVILTNELTAVNDEKDWENIREYLYRGGFIYIDACVHVTPDLKSFRQEHLSRLTALLPGSEIRRLSPKHPIFSACFPIDLSVLHGDPQDPPGESRAMYGVYDDDRMVALLSLAHLFCGWPQEPSTVEIKMEQIANTYVYARTR